MSNKIVEIDSNDYERLLSLKGESIEKSAMVEKSEFIESLGEDILQSLDMAQGVIVEFLTHGDTEFMEISEILTELYNYIDDERTEVIFGATADDEISIEQIQYKITVTGIE